MGLLARRNLFHDRVRFAVTLVELNSGQQLPLGLRVDSYVRKRRGYVGEIVSWDGGRDPRRGSKGPYMGMMKWTVFRI